MAKEHNVDGAGAEDQTDSQEAQTLSMEQVEKLVAERLEKERKDWQSRFDKLRNEKTEAEKALEDTEKSWQQRLQEEVSGVRKELESYKTEAQIAQLRSQALKRVSGAGLDLDDVEEKLVYRLIDPNADNPLADVEAYVEREKQKSEKIRLSAADEFAKKNGRKVTSSEGDAYSHMSYRDMAALPNDEFAKIPTDVVQKALTAELEQKE